MTTVNIVLIALGMTCIGILVYLTWATALLRKELRLRKKAIDRQNFSLVSEALERERNRISTELHDELGTLLSVVYLDLELVSHEASSLTPYAETRLGEVKRNLNLVIEAIRTNVWNLSSQFFDQVDLAFALRELCHKMDRYRGTHVTFVQSGLSFPLTEKVKLNLFRITQELLTNAIKHSSAWNISIHLHWEKSNRLSIIVEDDGNAWVQPRWQERDGMGITNILKRADFIGASITREVIERGQRTIIDLT